MISVTVPGDNTQMAPNKRLHWSRRAALVKQAKALALTAWLLAGRPVWPGPWLVVVQPIIRRARVMDDDNALASLKAVRDGLFGGKVTPDDSARFVRFLMPMQETGARWRGREEVEFVLGADGASPKR